MFAPEHPYWLEVDLKILIKRSFFFSLVPLFVLIGTGFLSTDKITDTLAQGENRNCTTTFYHAPWIKYIVDDEVLISLNPSLTQHWIDVLDDLGATDIEAMTLPWGFNGNTIILTRAPDNTKVNEHEMAHAKQVCEEGAYDFYFNYLTSSTYRLAQEKAAKDYSDGDLVYNAY